MLKYCLKWETPFKTGFKLPIGRRLRLGGNTMRLVHVQGDLYTGMDTATLLANHNKLKHGPWEEKNLLGLRPKVCITTTTNTAGFFGGLLPFTQIG